MADLEQSVIALLEKEAPSLDSILKKEFCGMILQHNKKRAISSGARVDAKSISERPCFLCRNNRPKTQGSIVFDEDFEILVNPYPILEGHLTIPLRRHSPQQIAPYLDKMTQLAKRLPNFILFYNGGKCGASAPDHAHFQAVFANQTPMEKSRDNSDAVPSLKNMTLLHKVEDVERYIGSLPKEENELEPKINLFCRYLTDDGTFDFYVFRRKKHRPRCYEEGIMISPGALDMAGILVLPQEEVYNNITKEQILSVFDEV